MPRVLRDLIPVVGYTCLLGGLVYAWKTEGLPLSKAALIAFFAGLAIWFFTRFADSIQVDGAPHIESHWGGLGGGVGGWRVSTSLVYLGGAIVFGIILLLVVQPPKAVHDATTKSESKTADKDAKQENKSSGAIDKSGTIEPAKPADSVKGASEPKSESNRMAAPDKDSVLPQRPPASPATAK